MRPPYAAALILLLALPGCPRKPATTNVISIDGSTTMYELSRAWARAFMDRNPSITVQVSRSGTARGIEAFLDGRCDIAETSRKLTAEEILGARKKGIRIEEFTVGFAVYAVVVHPSNPVTRLDEDQVRGIFLGRIASWSEVGGHDDPIDVLYREIPPREHDHFLERFVNISQDVDPPPSHRIVPSPSEIAAEVRTNHNAIGYLFIQDLEPGLQTLAIARKGSSTYLEPTVDAAAYPILRPYYMYARKDYLRPFKDFVRFIYSEEGQDISRKMKFVPVPATGGEIDRDVLFEFL